MTVFASLVYIGPSKMLDSDHRLLVMNIDFPYSKNDLNDELCQENYRFGNQIRKDPSKPDGRRFSE